jgi:putative membrane protein
MLQKSFRFGADFHLVSNLHILFVFPLSPPSRQRRPLPAARVATVSPDPTVPASMPGLAVIPSQVLPSAAVAYVHYLSFMLCFGALVLERRLIRPNPDRKDAILMVVTDVVYGIAALALLLSGLARVLHFGQGTSFYTENPVFWWKVGLFLAVGSLSLYPTITYILWAIPLRKGELPQVSEALANRLRWILNIELVGFASIPLLATLMARGVGLGG